MSDLPTEPLSAMTEERRRELAIRRIKARHDFRIHLVVYDVVNAALVGACFLMSEQCSGPRAFVVQLWCRGTSDPTPDEGADGVQLAPFTEPTRDEEDTIKAIVRHEYGSPDALELGDIDRPASGQGRRSAGIRSGGWREQVVCGDEDLGDLTKHGSGGFAEYV